MMNRKSLLIGLSLIITLGFSANASAQTSDLIPLDGRNHYGQFWIDNIHVVEHEYYKVIFMDVHVKAKDLALEDSSVVYYDSITLTNENGKKYPSEQVTGGSDCKKEWNGSFYVISGVEGKDGGIGTHSSCYMVEKEFNNFKVYYNLPYNNREYPSFQIGKIDLNQNSVTTNSDVNNPNSNLSTSPNPSPTMSNAQDFFTQLLEWFKNLFKF